HRTKRIEREIVAAVRIPARLIVLVDVWLMNVGAALVEFGLITTVRLPPLRSVWIGVTAVPMPPPAAYITKLESFARPVTVKLPLRVMVPAPSCHVPGTELV